ncbi:hypothetical protein PPTG_23917 [Phytophthora nicotianae INRA-310]|uniref:Uncharacterized protein n=1 Tax=Phytophthora nicotianae (strain INRA-310) TaxID=761204 RepID=W2PR20_PHYN3|nr:hypothetical protein PPTG_23917 [Phytophthora nicotianae INRA-310]ETN02440.1 hypothetical protein PPTG_23917 [Phytophthora nicotianae INRA-310]
MLSTLFRGKELFKSANRDEAVTYGAPCRAPPWMASATTPPTAAGRCHPAVTGY